MRLFHFIRISLLLISLVAVLFVMRNIDSAKTGRFLSALGIDEGAGNSVSLHPSSGAPRPGTHPMNICPTRILALIWPDGRKIEEDKTAMKLRWEASLGGGGVPREINSLNMEKWLSQHCQIQVVIPKPGGAPAPDSFRDVLHFHFVDRSQIALQKASGPDQTPIYKLGTLVFQSQDLTGALADLGQVANFENPAKAP